MFNFFNRSVETAPLTEAHIDENNNLFSPTGQLIGQYSRRRDAIRGAKRRGFEVATA